MTTSTPRRVVILGHALHNDFGPVERLLGVRFEELIPNFAGTSDTQSIASKATMSGKGQLSLMYLCTERYKLSKRVIPQWYDYKKRELRGCSKGAYEGQHNALNDAVMTMKVFFAQALDQGLYEFSRDSNLSAFDKLLKLVRLGTDFEEDEPAPIVISIDTETVALPPRVSSYDMEADLFEVGFAWADLEEVRKHRPNGKRAQGWYQCIEQVLYRIKPHQKYRYRKPWMVSPPRHLEPPREVTRIVDDEELLEDLVKRLHKMGARVDATVPERQELHRPWSPRSPGPVAPWLHSPLLQSEQAPFRYGLLAVSTPEGTKHVPLAVPVL